LCISCSSFVHVYRSLKRGLFLVLYAGKISVPLSGERGCLGASLKGCMKSNQIKHLGAN
jgi:hypothetical protein